MTSINIQPTWLCVAKGYVAAVQTNSDIAKAELRKELERLNNGQINKCMDFIERRDVPLTEIAKDITKLYQLCWLHDEAKEIHDGE